jgi:hypothetical protein
VCLLFHPVHQVCTSELHSQNAAYLGPEIINEKRDTFSVVVKRLLCGANMADTQWNSPGKLPYT